MRDEIRGLARLIQESCRLTVFTGAGISTESGIPDFRSPGGIWERFDPEDMTFESFLADDEGRRRYWQFHHDCWKSFGDAEPNPAHLAVARLQECAEVGAVITQNIDGLHQRAGSSEELVLELHGTMWEVKCLECGERRGWRKVFDLLENEITVPRCEVCGGILKPGTVAFGEPVPDDTFTAARDASISCDLFLCIGSSLSVFPAALLPRMALESGSRLVIINRDPTPLDGSAELVIQGLAGETLPAAVALVEETG